MASLVRFMLLDLDTHLDASVLSNSHGVSVHSHVYTACQMPITSERSWMQADIVQALAWAAGRQFGEIAYG